MVLKSGAAGIVRHGPSDSSALDPRPGRQGRARRGGRPRHHRRLAQRQARVPLPARHPHRHRQVGRPAGRRSLQAHPGGAARRTSTRSPRSSSSSRSADDPRRDQGGRPAPRRRARPGLDRLGRSRSPTGHPDLVLVTRDRHRAPARPGSSAPSRASGPASCSTSSSLETLGLTSLLLTLAGYFAGRLGDVTTKSSAHPPSSPSRSGRSGSGSAPPSSTSCSARRVSAVGVLRRRAPADPRAEPAPRVPALRPLPPDLPRSPRASAGR